MRSGQPVVDRIEQFIDHQRNVSWVSTTKVPMFDWSGQVTGIAAISRDISALKNSEQMLREQNERNRLIIETATDAFIGSDAQNIITDWNPRAEAIFGWTAAEAKGRRMCHTMIAPTCPNECSRAECLLTRFENGIIESVGVHRDGHRFARKSRSGQSPWEAFAPITLSRAYQRAPARRGRSETRQGRRRIRQSRQERIPDHHES